MLGAGLQGALFPHVHFKWSIAPLGGWDQTEQAVKHFKPERAEEDPR